MNKDIKQLLRLAEKQGFECTPFKRGQYVTNPRTQETVQVYSDCSGGRGLIPGVRRDLRSIGWDDPYLPPRKSAKESAEHQAATSKPVPDTPEEPRMPQPDTPNASPQSAAASAGLKEIMEDPDVAAGCIAVRLRDLARNDGGKSIKLRLAGVERPGYKWDGDIKTAALFYLWEDLAKLPAVQLQKVYELLVPSLMRVGVSCIHQRGRGAKSTWFVPDEEDAAVEAAPATPAGPASQATFQSATPSPPQQENAPVRSTANEAGRGYPCTEDGCPYVADTEAALNAHFARTVGDHRQFVQPGAPFRCNDMLAKLTDGRVTCVMQAGTAESVINHARRRHPETQGVQFCKVCLEPLPMNRQALQNHNGRFHGDRGKKGHGSSPAPKFAAPRAAVPNQPPPALAPPAPAPPKAAAPPAAPAGKPDRGDANAATPTTAAGAEEALEDIRAVFERYRQGLDAETAQLRAKITALGAENEDLREQLRRAAVDREELERLRSEVAAFEQIRGAMSLLMNNQR